MKSALLMILILSMSAAAARPNFQDNLLKSKSAKVKTNGEGAHWTLSDWLAQKNQAALMDQWLAAHSHQPWFGVDMAAKMVSYTVKTESAGTTTRDDRSAEIYQTDISLWLLSLGGEYQKTSAKAESIGASAGLRLLGADSQSTSLVARYGVMRLNKLPTVERWENPYLEGLLQFYLFQEFGIDGMYRGYFPATSNQGTELTGHKVSAGVFFEFAVIRIFGEYFQEPLTLNKSGTITKESSDGYDVGLRIFL